MWQNALPETISQKPEAVVVAPAVAVVAALAAVVAVLAVLAVLAPPPITVVAGAAVAVVTRAAVVVATGAAVVVVGGFVPVGVVVLAVLSVDNCAKSIVVPNPVAHTLKPAYRTLESLLHTISAPCESTSPCVGACPLLYLTPATVK